MALLDKKSVLNEADVLSFFGGDALIAKRLMDVADEIKNEVRHVAANSSNAL